MSPQDVVILLLIVASGDQPWKQSNFAKFLGISQSEISKSMMRSKNATLLDSSSRKVNRLALSGFLEYGIRYVFPQHPGPIVRGIPTAHSAPPLKSIILGDEPYVWPSANGTIKGQSIRPLYPSLIHNVLQNQMLYELLALVDAIRVGKVREREIAVKELKKQILGGE